MIDSHKLFDYGAIIFKNEECLSQRVTSIPFEYSNINQPKCNAVLGTNLIALVAIKLRPILIHYIKGKLLIKDIFNVEKFPEKTSGLAVDDSLNVFEWEYWYTAENSIIVLNLNLFSGYPRKQKEIDCNVDFWEAKVGLGYGRIG